jgi:hypothetical protein
MSVSRSHKLWSAATVCVILLAGCCKEPKPGTVLDEARQAGRSADSFPAAADAYFHDMDMTKDGVLKLTPDEEKGRNTWIVWTGGNDRLWDTLSVKSVGALDFVKTLSSSVPDSNPPLPAGRHNRWHWLGLVNEPCFEEAKGPDPDRWGLWLDKRIVSPDCPPDPFEDESKYPGVKVGSRGTKVLGKDFPVGSFYGYASGIVGLRLFPNPAFDEAAAKKWDPKRYYNDPSYYKNKDLVRPYRVGMACGFCHIGPNPLKPPSDPENPKWENLSSNVGAQFFWISRIFDWDADPSNFVEQLFGASRPGSLDTSLVSTDNINNPRTMNAVYYLKPRLMEAQRWGKETLSGGGLNNKQFNDYVSSGFLTEFFQKPDTVWSPRVLKDGADSVGALGALNRVYLNIGLFSEEWLLHFNALVGGKPTTPIEIAVSEKNSAYWQATEMQTPDMALFFLKSTDPHHLQDAPGGKEYLAKPKDAKLTQGKIVFAERCARCHSSKAPEPPEGLIPGGCSGPNYMDCWNRYWAWTKTDDYKKKMREIVMKDDFLQDNFLSSELRVPVTLLQTNACSPLATNAIRDNIWDNFSSETYKQLPSVGSITIYNPFSGQPQQYAMPAGGRGYTRPASLVSVWSTAPFLLNNSVGPFNEEPSVQARMDSFQKSIEQMLWPEKREHDPVIGSKMPLGDNGLPLPSKIDRTSKTSYLRVAGGYLPKSLQRLSGWLAWLLPNLFGSEEIQIGPIPQGTPVNLLASLQLLSEDTSEAARAQHDARVLELLLKVKHDLEALPPGASDAEAEKVFANLEEPLFQLSKCPDYVVNRGHYFGTNYFKEEPGLSDDEKYALVEFLKTF